MTLAALLATLTSSLGWAGFDVTRKALAHRVPIVPLALVLVSAQLPLFGAWAAFAADAIYVHPGYLLPGLLAVSLNVSANLMLLKALAIAPLSLTIPFLSLTPALTALAAIPLLGEWPTLGQWTGISLVVAGAALLGWFGARREVASVGPLVQRRVVLRGALLMTAVAGSWAVTGPIDKLALQHASPPVHAFVQVGGVATMLLLLALLRAELSGLAQLRRRTLTAGVAVLCGAIGMGLQFVAIRLTLVSLVETIKRGVGLAGSVVNGRLLFSEPITSPKLAAVAVIAAGVGLTLLTGGPPQ